MKNKNPFYVAILAVAYLVGMLAMVVFLSGCNDRYHPCATYEKPVIHEMYHKNNHRH